MERRMEATKGGRERGARKEFERLYSGYVDLNVGPSDKNKKYVCEGSLEFFGTGSTNCHQVELLYYASPG